MKALPDPSTATQKLDDVQETDVSATPSTWLGAPQLPDVSIVASPARSTSAQKLDVGHEIDEG